jgi:glycosyltransferase involved in cell wall biosynthesis
MNKISGAVVCYNEIAVIERALICLKSFCDEIVVYDSFSTDGTYEMAKKYTDKVFQHEFDNHRDQKNRAIEQCTNDWVFLIDSDEYLDDLLLASMQKLTSDPRVDAWGMPRKNFLDGDGPLGYPDFQTRLFKKYVRHFGHPFHHRTDGNSKMHMYTRDCGAIIHDKTWDRQKRQNQMYYYFRPQDYKEKPEGVENIKLDMNIIKNPENVNVYRDFLTKNRGQ